MTAWNWCASNEVYHVYHTSIDPNKNLNESNLHFYFYGIRGFAENVQLKVNSKNKESNRKKPVLHISNESTDSANTILKKLHLANVNRS